MPGANCSILGCTTYRIKGGLAIFQIPSGTDEYNTNWRNKLVNIITRDRVIDHDLQRQIDEGRLHTCELHYLENQLNKSEKRTLLIPGSLPTLNLPQKSFPRPKTTRPSASIAKREQYVQEQVQRQNQVQNPDKYKSIDEFKTRFGKLQLSGPNEWVMRDQGSATLYLEKSDTVHVIPKYQIVVEKDLTFNILVYNWLVPKNNVIFM